MKFRNANPSSPLSFDCGGTHYDVPVGGTCEIPERFVYAVESMRVQLEPVSDDADKPEVKAAAEPQQDPKADKPEVKAGQQAKR